MAEKTPAGKFVSVVEFSLFMPCCLVNTNKSLTRVFRIFPLCIRALDQSSRDEAYRIVHSYFVSCFHLCSRSSQAYPNACAIRGVFIYGAGFSRHQPGMSLWNKISIGVMKKVLNVALTI